MAVSSQSSAEKSTLSAADGYWFLHRRFLLSLSKLIVEVDGGQHQDNFEEDEMRTRWLEKQGFRVLRFWNNQVLSSVEAVVDAIFLSIDDGSME